MKLSIIEEKCIRCGKCAKVCPVQIMGRSAAGEAIVLRRVESCIVCGHCVAVCAAGAVRHSEFPASAVHPIDRAALPSPEQVMALCRARRSNRAISHRPIPQEALDRILEAAHRAPTATNAQQVRFTLITDPETLQRVIRFTIDSLMRIVKMLENPLVKPILKRTSPAMYNYIPAFRRLQKEYGRGEDPILRGGTALLLIHTPASDRFGAADANLAYQNGSLMAESLGISQVYTGFVVSALQMDKKERFLRSLGIAGRVHAGMALGVPEFLYPNYVDRRPIEVERI